MKKHLSFLLFYILCANASAQVTTSIKAGINFANVENKGDDNNQMRFVGYAGFSVNIEMPNKLFVQPELLYSMRGYRAAPYNFNDKGTVAFDYITVPILIGYKVSKNFSIMAGPEFGYMVRAHSRFGDYEFDFYGGIQRKFNVDVDAGFTWQIAQAIALEARANFGVTALYRGVLTDPQGYDFASVKDGYHRVLQLGLSIPL